MNKPAAAPRCFFAACKRPVTHTVQRLWLLKGKPLPLLHCCEQHQPGGALLNNPALAERLAERLRVPVYRVERISDVA